MKKLLILLTMLIVGIGSSWADDVLPTADVSAYFIQETPVMTSGGGNYTITTDGSGNVSISPNNSGIYGGTGRFTCTLVIKMNVPSTTSAGVLCDIRKAAGTGNDSNQGLYMAAERKLHTSWQGGARTNGTTLTTGEHTIIYTTGESGATVYVDGESKLTDGGLKASDKNYKCIYIPSAYASSITEVHFYPSIQSALNITTIASECSNHIFASQQIGESVNVSSGKTLVIDTDDNLSRYSGASSIAVAYGKTLTLNKDNSTISLSGEGTALQSTNITTTVTGNLTALTLKATTGTLKYTGKTDAEPTLNGTTLYGVTLASPKRLRATGNITIENLAGNNQSTAADTYAFYTDQNVSVTLKGNCDFTKKSDDSDATAQRIGVHKGGTLTIADNANVKVSKLYNSDVISNNTNITIGNGATLEITGISYSPAVTNNGTLTMGGKLTTNGLTLNEGSTINISGSNLSGATTVSGNATVNATADLTLGQPITVAASKTLTIDGGSNTVNLNVLPTFGASSKINFKNATINYPSDIRNLANYTFTSSTAQFVETGDEYKVGGFKITNIPSGVTVKVKKYGATDYETVTPTDGTVTISHSVGVSGSAAWLDYTFNESTKATNLHDPADQTITNAGNAGSGNNLTIDTGYNTDDSYNDDGTLKVKSTPWRDITWPTNYTVAVAGNVPDVENGCLVAFGSTTAGSQNYLAIIRGANQNEIKLVKGHGVDSAFEVISTMTAANATALSHLVVFTKNGDKFTVYLDGIQKTQVTYSDALGGGFQIGSIHGGVTGTNVGRVNDMATDIKNKIFAKAVRVYDYVISDDQMSQLTTEFPYTSFGGKYTRTITENSNLSATDAWLNTSTQGHVDVPVNAVVEDVTYYPDVEITTTAASTLTVNANMDTENIKFDGTGKLTIVGDGTHNISVYGSVKADGPVSVKYGEIDLSAVPISIGASGSVEFDFSDYDFSDVFDARVFTVTGNTSDYGDQVTAVYPSDTEYHTYSLDYNSTTNQYILTVEPTLALKQKQAIDIVTPYYNGNHVGTGVGKYNIALNETSYANMLDFETAVMSWESVGDYVEPTISFNTVPEGFYRFKAAGRSKSDNTYNWYMGGNADGIYSASTTATQATDANTIFYLKKDGSGYHPINYVSGLYSNGTANNTVGTMSDFTLTQAIKENNTDKLLGEYKLVNTGTSKTIVMLENTTLDAIDGNNDWSGWVIEPATSLPVTFNKAARGYATFNTPVELQIPDGVKAYVCKLDGNNMTFYSVTNVKDHYNKATIPANTAVMLYCEAVKKGGYANDVTVDFPVTLCDFVIDTKDNSFYGTLAAENYPDNKDVYSLRVNTTTNKVGFFKKSEGTLAGFKAWLKTDKSIGARTITINFDGESDPTGIVEALGLDNENVDIYDLNGRKLSSYRKGINIVNGKKVMIQ